MRRITVAREGDPRTPHFFTELQPGRIAAGQCCSFQIAEHEGNLQRVAGAQSAAQHRRLPGEEVDEHRGGMLRHLAIRHQ
jgi:hypothetical protein